MYDDYERYGLVHLSVGFGQIVGLGGWFSWVVWPGWEGSWAWLGGWLAGLGRSWEGVLGPGWGSGPVLAVLVGNGRLNRVFNGDQNGKF